MRKHHTYIYKHVSGQLSILELSTVSFLHDIANASETVELHKKQQFHKKPTSHTEQILEATSPKNAVIRSPTSHF